MANMEDSRDRNYSVGSLSSDFDQYSLRTSSSYCPFVILPAQTEASVPSRQQDLDYYQAYCDLYLQNLALQSKVQELQTHRRQILARIEACQVTQAKNTIKSDASSRKRRIADLIERHYNCGMCGRSYGAEGSLNQHVRLKHK
jgi:transcription elongation factor Elf1